MLELELREDLPELELRLPEERLLLPLALARSLFWLLERPLLLEDLPADEEDLEEEEEEELRDAIACPLVR